MNIIDLFSGAGGLTEGFRNKSYNIIAHVEMDPAACKTLQLRDAYYLLKDSKNLGIYNDFLSGTITYEDIMRVTGLNKNSSVLNETISAENISLIMDKIDHSLNGKKVHGIIGGPPCQAYSLVGRKRNESKKANDERIYLYKYYIKFLEKYKPDFFLFENVRGLRSFRDVDGELLLPKILQDFKNMTPSYNVRDEILNAAEYGVPQARQRLFVFGTRAGVTKSDFFTNLAQKKEKAITIRSLFKDLPKLHAGEENNKYSSQVPVSFVKNYIRNTDAPLTFNIARNNLPRDLAIYKIASNLRKDGKRLNYTELPSKLKTHKNNSSFLDRFKSLAYDEVAHTIVAHIAKDGHYYIHPDTSQNRSITVREAARIQTFPDDFFFMNTRTDAFKQIGNAVPPYLSKLMAETISHL